MHLNQTISTYKKCHLHLTKRARFCHRHERRAAHPPQQGEAARLERAGRRLGLGPGTGDGVSVVAEEGSCRTTHGEGHTGKKELPATAPTGCVEKKRTHKRRNTEACLWCRLGLSLRFCSSLVARRTEKGMRRGRAASTQRPSDTRGDEEEDTAGGWRGIPAGGSS